MEENNTNFIDEENKQQSGDSASTKQYSALSLLPKSYKIMLISFICIASVFVIGPLVLLPFIMLVVYAIRTFILAIKSLSELKRCDSLEKDNGYATAGVIVPVLIVISLAVTVSATLYAMENYMFRYDTVKLNAFGRAINDYSEAHNGQFPQMDRWCDIIKDSVEREGWTFEQYGTDDNSCNYVLNEEAARLGADAPGDMILLFESELGWNQVGGLDLLKKSKKGRLNVLFVNNDVRFMRKKQALSLRWKLEDKVSFLHVNLTKQLILWSCIFSIPFVWILVKFSSYMKRYWTFLIVLTVLSIGIGMLLGMAAEVLYLIDGNKNCGWVIGGIIGFAVAVCYVLLLAAKFETKESDVNIVGYATLSGILAGMICSTLVHILLMICHEEINIVNILVGLGFGSFAGVILGWISSGVMLKFYKKTVPEVLEPCDEVS